MTDLSCTTFPNKVTLSLRRGTELPCCEHGLCTVTCFLSAVRKREEWFYSRNRTHATSDRCSRSTSTVVSHVASVYFWYEVYKCHFPSAAFLPQIHNLSLIMRKNSLIQREGRSAKHSFSTPQNSQGHPKQGHPRNCPNHRGLRDMMTKCDVVSWMRSQSRGGILGKNKTKQKTKKKEIWIQYGLCVNETVWI